MVEFAPLEQFADSSPRTLVFPFPDFVSIANNDQHVYFETSGNSLWRVRYFHVEGMATGTVNGSTVTLGVYADNSPAAGFEFVNVNSASPMTLIAGRYSNFTWSTEVGNTYSAENSPSGRSSNVALPMTFLPAFSTVVLACSSVAGSDNGFDIDGASLIIEKFPPGFLSGGEQGQGGKVYLLPQTI